MYDWDTSDPKFRELLVSGDDFVRFPEMTIKFGPIEVSLGLLAHYGWKLRMRQRTPLLVPKTRCTISLSPGDRLEHGFRWKLRARAPFKSPEEVFEYIRLQPPNQFSLANYETKAGSDLRLAAENRRLKEENDLLRKKTLPDDVLRKIKSVNSLDYSDMRKALDLTKGDLAAAEAENRSLRAELAKARDEAKNADLFDLLARWNEEQIGKYDWSVPAEKNNPCGEIPLPTHRLPIVAGDVDLTELFKKRSKIQETDRRIFQILGE